MAVPSKHSAKRVCCMIWQKRLVFQMKRLIARRVTGLAPRKSTALVLIVCPSLNRMRYVRRTQLLMRTFWSMRTTASAFSTALLDASTTIRAEDIILWDYCGIKNMIGATTLKMSTVEQGPVTIQIGAMKITNRTLSHNCHHLEYNTLPPNQHSRGAYAAPAEVQ